MLSHRKLLLEKNIRDVGEGPDVYVDDDDIKSPPERHTDLLPTQSEDDRDEACKMTATRSVSTASITFVAANATTMHSMLKDHTEVFVAVVNEDDKKSPLPLEWTRIDKPLLILLTLAKLKR